MNELPELTDEIVPYAKCTSDPKPGSYRMTVEPAKMCAAPVKRTSDFAMFVSGELVNGEFRIVNGEVQQK
jgi:hypothetical protein